MFLKSDINFEYIRLGWAAADRLLVPAPTFFLDAAVSDGSLNSTIAATIRPFYKGAWGDRPAGLDWSNLSSAFLTQDGS